MGGGTAGSRAERVFEKYAGTIGDFDGYSRKMDWNHYDMGQRLKLAEIVRQDMEQKGTLHRPVVDLGSECGGMTYALLEEGLNVISVERDFENYLVSRLVNDKTIQCDAFDMADVKDAGALVSYMFLGACMPYETDESGTPDAGKKNAENLRAVFDTLGESSDTIYSVELQREISGWFGWHALDGKQIHEKLKEALPDWEIDSLGDFGVFTSSYDDVEDRLGFRFTKQRGNSNER